MRTIVIVGASLAGLRAAQTLRREGFDGTLRVIGEESRAPYDRPPLSKQVLAGEWDTDRLELAPPDDLDALDVEWILGRRATGLDVAARTVAIEGDELIDFDGLVIATGARCRELPGSRELDGVYTLRSLDDCLQIRRDFDDGPSRVVVVGAGFIGAEVAATARDRGLDVTMIEMEAVPLGLVLGTEMGEVCAAVHRDHGVDLRLSSIVDSLEGADRVEGVRLADGSVIEAEVVVAGIGVIPNTEWLEGSGLTIDDGVVCDETCRAAPGIVAAGDAARWPNRRFDDVMRVEHWDNAVEQGTHAARTLLAGDAGGEPYEPVPWFWSDQYDRKIQLAGRTNGHDDVAIVTGTIEERRFAAAYRRGDRLVAILGFNRPRHVMQYRQLISDGASWDEAMEFSRA